MHDGMKTCTVLNQVPRQEDVSCVPSNDVWL